MAKMIDKIVKSENVPQSTNVLWDDGENLKIYRNGVWENTNKGDTGSDIANLLEALKPVQLSDYPPEGSVTQEQLDEIGLTEKVINNIINGYTSKICIYNTIYSITWAHGSEYNSVFIFSYFYFDTSGEINTIKQYTCNKYLDEITIEYFEI